jgi:predicted outer membrane repeat protein
MTRWIHRLFRTNPTPQPTAPASSRRGRFQPRLEVLDDRLAPAVFTVDALTDTGAGTGPAGDLRYCVNQANLDPGADTITFDPTVFAGPSTITLSGSLGALALADATGATAVQGPGSGLLTISGNNETGVFKVFAGVTATLDGLTITQGSAVAGGGILNQGTLTVSNSVVSNNVSPGFGVGGGIDNDLGALTLSNTTVSGNQGFIGGGIANLFVNDTLTITGGSVTGNTSTGNGGGIYTNGTASIDGCTISGNNATRGNNGGGIYNDGTNGGGTLTLTNSTVSGNSGVNGGGIDSGGVSVTMMNDTISGNAGSLGGGMAIGSVGVPTVANCTFSGNTASGNGGGVIFVGGSVALTNCTITANRANNQVPNGAADTGGGLFVVGGVATLTNTIVAGNVTGTGSTADDLQGVAVDPASGFNLIGTGGSGGLVDGQNGNHVGVADPGLGVLAGYGGPTQTVALLPGSPAIDAGTTAGVPAADQRGLGRVGGVDIGAFESQGFTLTLAGGDDQSAMVGTAFASPLVATVTANNAAEPIVGGVVTFTGPGSGAGTDPAVSVAVIDANGQASTPVTANGVGGAYHVTGATAGAANPVSWSLTNTPAPTTTTPTTASATFSPTDQTVTLSASVTSTFGTVNGGSVTFTVQRGATVVGSPVTAVVSGGAASAPFTLPGGTAAGSLTITADYDPGTTTFAAGTGTATLSVGKTDQTITFTVTSPATYGVSPITLTATATSGLPVSFTLVSGPGTLSGGVLTVTGAGSIVIQADQPGDANYNLAPPVQQTLIVTPAPLTVTVDGAARVYGQPNPAFTAGYAGLVNGDTPADLTGTLTFATPAVTNSPRGTYPVIPSGLSSTNYDITFAGGTLTVSAVVERVAIGAGPGGGPRVQVLDASGAKLFDFFAYDASLRGGVSVATADVTGDGTEDIITGAGLGGGTNVKVFDGMTGNLVVSWFAYGDTFRGGVWVTAGDVDGDGSSEVITGPGPGGGPVVGVWKLEAGVATEVVSILAFDEAFRGGVTVAYGRDGTGTPVIVAGAGVGGAPRVRTFDAQTHALLVDVLVYEPSFVGGVYVATGDVLGIGSSQVLVGPGPGGGPRLRVFGLDGTEEGNLFAALDALRNGLTVAAMGQSSGPAAILVGAGQGAFQGEMSDGALTGLARVGFFEPGFQGGVFVG